MKMPFGLKNPPEVFRLLWEQVLSGCKNFATNYIDDIFIYSVCWDDHVAPHVSLVLEAASLNASIERSRAANS